MPTRVDRRPGRWLPAGLTLLAVLVILPPVEGAPITREDWGEGNYVDIYLTWNGGKGGLARAGDGSEDPGGPGTVEPKDSPRFVFSGQPLASDVHINASRLIKVDLYTKGQSSSSGNGHSCSGDGLGARLYADDVFVGGIGTYQGSHVYRISTTSHPGEPAAQFPPDPSGYGVCRLRFGAETDFIGRGSTLRLVVTNNFTSDLMFGMGGDHRSLIQIAQFSADEMPYRYPSYAHGLPADDIGAGSGSLISRLGFLGLALSVPAAIGSPRRSRAALLATLLLAMAFSGCTGKSSGTRGAFDDRGTPPVTIQPAFQNGSLSSAGRGSIAGQVMASDANLPVGGAYAALLGAANATTTDSYGRFVFKELVPGTYHLRVDREAYQPMEGFVAVRANFISFVNVTLSPLSGGVALRPHRHDYWGEETERVIVRNMPVLATSCGSTPGYGGSCVNTVGHPIAFGVPPPTDPSAYNSILPGTRDVNVTVDWDPNDLAQPWAWLTYQAGNDPSLQNESILAPRYRGQPFHIATTWEMEDPGHQHFSTWVFRMYFPYASDGTSCPDPDVVACDRMARQYVDGVRLNVTITITKGTVPYGRAHPNLWAGASGITIVQTERNGTMGRLGAERQTVDWNYAWVPEILVPPGTAWVEVWANSTRPLAPDYSVDLRYRTAAPGAPRLDCWASRSEGSPCDGPEYVHATNPTKSGLSTYWRFDAKDVDADPYYSVRSFWVFGLRPAQDAATLALAYADYAAAGQTAPHFKLTVILHRGVGTSD